MASAPFLEALAIFVVAAALFVFAARLVRMPSIVAYILAGLFIGPVAGIVEPRAAHDAIDVMSEMGIALLLFLVGLELNLERIKQVGKVAVAAGLGQVLFTAAGGALISIALGFSLVEALFLAVALTFSSTVVVVKLLAQKEELFSLYGRIAVGIFLVQDVVVIVVLTFLSGLEAGGALDLAAVARGLGIAFGGAALLLVVTALSARFVLPRPFAWAARSPRTLFFWSLAWCFGYVLAASALGLSAELGAFLAGIALAQLKSAPHLGRRLGPLMSFGIAIFFVSLGAGIDLTGAAARGVEAAVLTLFVVVGKGALFMWIIARFGYSERTCFLTSVTVAQISELSFLVAAMGVSAGLITPPLLSLITVVGVLTIALSSYMILYNHQLYAMIKRTGVLRVFGAGQEDEPPPKERREGHVVVVGMNAFGRDLARELSRRGERVVAVDRDARKLADLPCETLAGDVDYLSTLEECDLFRASFAACALRTESASRLFSYRCKESGVPCVAYAFDRGMLEELREIGVDFVIDTKRPAGSRMLEALQAIEEQRP